MSLNIYKYSTNNSYLDYRFESIGPKGAVKKVVRFSKIAYGIYNLGFGDWDENTGEISDSVVTNNEDTEKVLSTVAMIADDFSLIYTGVIIFIEGNVPAKTRLYQMNIAKYWAMINEIFEVQGLIGEDWELFQKKVNYDAFIARRRNK